MPGEAERQRDCILVVDADKELLAGVRKAFEGRYEVVTTASGQEAIETARRTRAIAVAVAGASDMDGLELLTRVWTEAPDAVRILIADREHLNDAVKAANEDVIFRFALRPCSGAELTWAIEAGLARFRFARQERELLEKTLAGSIRALTEVLSVVNPNAFKQTTRIRRLVDYMTERLGLHDRWEFAIAALVSNIGCVSLPPETLTHLEAGQALTREEREMYDEHPAIAQRLLMNIPRLGHVARIVGLQADPPRPDSEAAIRRDPVALGAHLLKTAVDLDAMLARGITMKNAVLRLKGTAKPPPGFILDALEGIDRTTESARTTSRTVRIAELDTTMVLDEDLVSMAGAILVPRGQPVTGALLVRLRNFARRTTIREPVRVTFRT